MYKLKTYYTDSSDLSYKGDLSYIVSWLDDIALLDEKKNKHKALTGVNFVRSYLEHYEDFEITQIEAFDYDGHRLDDVILIKDEGLSFLGRDEEKTLFKENEFVTYLDRSSNRLRIGLVAGVPSNKNNVMKFEQNCDDVYMIYYLGREGKLEHSHPHQLMLFSKKFISGAKDEKETLLKLYLASQNS